MFTPLMFAKPHNHTLVLTMVLITYSHLQVYEKTKDTIHATHI